MNVNYLLRKTQLLRNLSTHILNHHSVFPDHIQYFLWYHLPAVKILHIQQH